MAEPAVIAAGGGRPFSTGPSQARVKVDVGEASFAVFESELPPHADGPPLHVHDAYDEAFYVLEGAVSFEVEGATHEVGRGGVAFVPRGARHRFANRAGAPARLLVITTPDALNLIEAHGATAGDPQRLAEVYRSHRSALVA